MESTLIQCIYNNHIEVVKILLNYGVNVNFFDGEALKMACCMQNHEIIKLLLDKGADPRHALRFTCFCPTLEIIKILFENSPNYNLKQEKIILQFCCLSENDSHYEIVKYLIDNDVSLEIYNSSNPIEWSVTKKNIKIIKLFIEKGIKINDNVIKLCAEISKNDDYYEIVKLFYENGANFYVVDFDPSNVQILKLLKDGFQDIEFRDSDICPISYESFRKEDEKLGCIKCKNVFKKDALNEWLKYNPICPMCREFSRFQKVDK